MPLLESIVSSRNGSQRPLRHVYHPVAAALSVIEPRADNQLRYYQTLHHHMVAQLKADNHMSRYVTFLLLLFAAPVSALAQNGSCKFLCKPVFLIEPTVTFEKDATVFETVFALDLSTPIPRVGVTLEAITKPFSEDNDVELESELNLYWLESEQTQGWVSSHIDFIDKFSPAKRTTDTRAYTHKLNLELDTAVAVFNRLPAGRWLRDVEIEGSLDYVATGLPAGTPRWSFSVVFVIPFVKGG